MTIFQIIIALAITFLTLDSIVLGSRKRVFPVLLYLPILFLLFLAIRLDGLIRVRQSGGFAICLFCFLRPELFGAEFLGSGSLSLHIHRSAMGQAVALGVMGIRVPNHDAGSLAYLDFYIDCFYTIFSKLVDTRFCCSISTLMEDLRPF